VNLGQAFWARKLSVSLLRFRAPLHSNYKANGFQNTQNGSLLVMKDETQNHWLHGFPTKLVGKPRVNLTFRTIVIGR
jgi:hypothetical protein